MWKCYFIPPPYGGGHACLFFVWFSVRKQQNNYVLIRIKEISTCTPFQTCMRARPSTFVEGGHEQELGMKICAAQTRPITGDIAGNIGNHKKLIDLAVSQAADIMIFPELSITGYEPERAKALATHQDDKRFDVLQNIADANEIALGVGIPISSRNGVCIGLVIFQPHEPRQTYSKKYLHADDEEYFCSGQSFSVLRRGGINFAPALCYELSVPEHSEQAFKNGANIYLVSVAKTSHGIENATKSLSNIAIKYSMTVLMSNCVGPCDGFESAGHSSLWNKQGVLVGQLDDMKEGILIFDTVTQRVTALTI